jgi:hypothetical protein
MTKPRSGWHRTGFDIADGTHHERSHPDFLDLIHRIELVRVRFADGIPDSVVRVVAAVVALAFPAGCFLGQA